MLKTPSSSSENQLGMFDEKIYDEYAGESGNSGDVG